MRITHEKKKKFGLGIITILVFSALFVIFSPQTEKAIQKDNLYITPYYYTASTQDLVLSELSIQETYQSHSIIFNGSTGEAPHAAGFGWTFNVLIRDSIIITPPRDSAVILKSAGIYAVNLNRLTLINCTIIARYGIVLENVANFTMINSTILNATEAIYSRTSMVNVLQSHINGTLGVYSDASEVSISESILDLLQNIEYRSGTMMGSFYSNVYFSAAESQFYCEIQKLMGNDYLVGQNPEFGDSRPLYPIKFSSIGELSVTAPAKVGTNSVMLNVEVAGNTKMIVNGSSPLIDGNVQKYQFNASGLVYGANHISFVGAPIVGNQSIAETVVFADLIAPSIEVSAPSQSGEFSPTLTLTAQDDSLISLIEITYAGFNETFTYSSNSISSQIELNHWSAIENNTMISVHVKASDEWEHESTETIEIQKLIIVPSISLSGDYYTKFPNFALVSENVAEFRVHLNNTEIFIGAILDSAQLNQKLNESGMQDGYYTLKVSGSYQNTERDTEISFVLDTTAPIITRLSTEIQGDLLFVKIEYSDLTPVALFVNSEMVIQYSTNGSCLGAIGRNTTAVFILMDSARNFVEITVSAPVEPRFEIDFYLFSLVLLGIIATTAIASIGRKLHMKVSLWRKSK